MDDPPDIPTGATSNGIQLRDVIGAVARAELLGVPVEDSDLDLLNF